MLGAPKPIAAPIMAKVRWARAFAEPATNEIAAMTNPIIETKGKIVPISFDCTAAKLDSTEQKPTIGKIKIVTEARNGIHFLEFTIMPLSD